MNISRETWAETQVRKLSHSRKEEKSNSSTSKDGQDTPKRTSSNAMPISAITSPFDRHSLEDVNQLSSPSYQSHELTHANKKDCDRWVSEISVDSHGGVCYHNPTSSFHEAPLSNGRSNSICSSAHELPSAIESNAHDKNQIKHSLVSNAAVQRRFEAMAMENMAGIQNEISSGMANEFLKFHWCWIHPTFQFVYRPAFTSKCLSMIFRTMVIEY